MAIRQPFTPEDHTALALFLSKYPEASRSRPSLFLEFAAKNPSHSVQSWHSHYKTSKETIDRKILKLRHERSIAKAATATAAAGLVHQPGPSRPGSSSHPTPAPSSTGTSGALSKNSNPKKCQAPPPSSEDEKADDDESEESEADSQPARKRAKFNDDDFAALVATFLDPDLSTNAQRYGYLANTIPAHTVASWQTYHAQNKAAVDSSVRRRLKKQRKAFERRDQEGAATQAAREERKVKKEKKDKKEASTEGKKGANAVSVSEVALLRAGDRAREKGQPALAVTELPSNEMEELVEQFARGEHFGWSREAVWANLAAQNPKYLKREWEQFYSKNKKEVMIRAAAKLEEIEAEVAGEVEMAVDMVKEEDVDEADQVPGLSFGRADLPQAIIGPSPPTPKPSSSPPQRFTQDANPHLSMSRDPVEPSSPHPATAAVDEPELIVQLPIEPLRSSQGTSVHADAKANKKAPASRVLLGPVHPHSPASSHVDTDDGRIEAAFERRAVPAFLTGEPFPASRSSATPRDADDEWLPLVGNEKDVEDLLLKYVADDEEWYLSRLGALEEEEEDLRQTEQIRRAEEEAKKRELEVAAGRQQKTQDDARAEEERLRRAREAGMKKGASSATEATRSSQAVASTSQWQLGDLPSLQTQRTPRIPRASLEAVRRASKSVSPEIARPSGTRSSAAPRSVPKESPVAPFATSKRPREASVEEDVAPPSPKRAKAELATRNLKDEIVQHAARLGLKTRDVKVIVYACSAGDTAELSKLINVFARWRTLDAEDRNFKEADAFLRHKLWLHEEDVILLGGTKAERSELKAAKGVGAFANRRKFLADYKIHSVADLQEKKRDWTSYR